MSTYYYQKNNNKRIVPHIKKPSTKKVRRFLGLLVIGLGLLCALYFFFPVLSYQFFLAGTFAQANIEVPVPKHMVASKGGIGSLFSQGLNSLTTDYNDARNWYPQLTGGHLGGEELESYTLSIPKLGITDALVSTVDYDLSKNLVHYYGTPNPTERGTAVIFGHSTIPAWFNPKDYKTIFATLHTIKVGDEINIGVKGFQYKYKIYSIIITDPLDTNIFAQGTDNSYITIVTCTPPGTTWKRLIVRASLEPM